MILSVNTFYSVEYVPLIIILLSSLHIASHVEHRLALLFSFFFALVGKSKKDILGCFGVSSEMREMSPVASRKVKVKII